MTKVLKLEDICGQTTEEVPKSDEQQKNTKKKEKQLVLPKGNLKSGRVWKNEKQRFKSISQTRGIKRSNALSKQMKLKEDLKRIKTISQARVQERTEQIEEKKERRRKNLAKQKENQLKSEVVQVINNPAKIKKMRKKQLRSIQKRDTTIVSK